MTNDFDNNKVFQDVTFSTADGPAKKTGAVKQKPPKKSKGRFKSVVAAILAVVIIGGGSGFGGAYFGSIALAGNNISSNSSKNDTSSAGAKSTTSEESTTPLFDNTSSQSNSNLLTATELYKKVKNTVVVVYNYQKVQGYNEVQLAGLGSGVMFTADGYVITNQHVVANSAKMTILCYDSTGEQREYEATVVGSDSATDLAILKVERDEVFEYASMGDSGKLEIGQDICALGNPLNLESSLTKGIVSGLGRQSNSSGYALSSIQIDAAINSGNSGGAIFDMYGNVMGIVNSKFIASNAENLGFAITINEAKPVINDLISYGYVTGRPGLGINGETITEYLAYLQGLNTTGVYVTYISEDKPVSKSGLRIGDIITAVDEENVTKLTDIQTIIAKKNIGDTVNLTVYRKNQAGNGSTVTITVELSEITLT